MSESRFVVKIPWQANRFIYLYCLFFPNVSVVLMTTKTVIRVIQKLVNTSAASIRANKHLRHSWSWSVETSSWSLHSRVNDIKCVCKLLQSAPILMSNGDMKEFILQNVMHTLNVQMDSGQIVPKLVQCTAEVIQSIQSYRQIHEYITAETYSIFYVLMLLGNYTPVWYTESISTLTLILFNAMQHNLINCLEQYHLNLSERFTKGVSF